MSLKDNLRLVFTDVLGSSKVDELVIRRYFSDNYIQKVDGKTLDLDGLISHMRAQKQSISQVQIEFLALVEEGNTVFSNHIVYAVKKDGSRVVIQVLAQFNFDEFGKIVYCDELTHLLQGEPDDADLGSRLN